MINGYSEDNLNKLMMYKSLFIGDAVEIIKKCLIFSGEIYDSQ